MIGARRTAGAVALALGGVLLIAGCNSGSDSTHTSAAATSTVAPVPTGFDPCNDVPQTVLDELQWTLKNPAQNSAADGTQWQGCTWSKIEYYAVTLYMTNATLDKVRAQHFQDTQDLSIAGRQAVSSRQAPDHPRNQCTIDVAIKGGSFEIFLSNSVGDSVGGNLDSCGLARDVANKIVPLLPASL